MSPEPFSFVADRGDAGRRLDQALVRRLHEVARLSRTMAQRWIASGAVEVDGRRAMKPSATVVEGATIAVQLPDSASMDRSSTALMRAIGERRPPVREIPVGVYWASSMTSSGTTAWTSGSRSNDARCEGDRTAT